MEKIPLRWMGGDGIAEFFFFFFLKKTLVKSTWWSDRMLELQSLREEPAVIMQKFSGKAGLTSPKTPNSLERAGLAT